MNKWLPEPANTACLSSETVSAVVFMLELILAIATFIASHIVLIQAPLRSRLETYFGEKLFRLLYSLLSLVILVWLAVAFKQAPYIQLWPTTALTTWVPVVIMPFACILLVSGLFSASPLSLSVRQKAFEPSRPGIVAITRHPVMWAFALWAMSHIPANGDLAGVLLFMLMLVLSLYGCKTIDRNKCIRLGKTNWVELSKNTSIIPFAAIVAGKTTVDWENINLLQIAAGLLTYALFAYFHIDIIGVAPPIISLFF